MRRLFCCIITCFFAGWLPAQQPYAHHYQTSEGLPSNYTYSAFQDSKGYIWVCSDVGVSRFDGHSFTHFNTSHGLPDNEVFSICEDHDGRLWFATLNGKAGFFLNGKIYNSQNTPLLQQCNLKGLVIKLMVLDDGRVAYSGMYKTVVIDFNRQQIEERITEKGVIIVWNNPNNVIGGIAAYFGWITPNGFQPVQQAPLMAQTIQSITTGDTLMVSSGPYFYFFNRYTGQFLAKVKGLTGNNHYIFLLKQGNYIWAGTRDGCLQLEYPSLKVCKTYLPGRAVSSVLPDRDGGLWFTTFEEGLYYVPDPDITFYNPAADQNRKRVICLSRDARQRLWIGMEGSAYAVFDGLHFESNVIFPQNVINKNIVNIRHLSNGRTFVISKAGTLLLDHDRPTGILVHRATDLNLDSKGQFWAGLNGLYLIPAEMTRQKIRSLAAARATPDSEPIYGIPNILKLKGTKVERIELDESDTPWVATRSGLYQIDSLGAEIKVLPHSMKDLIYDSTSQQLWALSESKGLFLIRNKQVLDSIPIRNQYGEVVCRDLCRDDAGDLWIGTASGLFRVQVQQGHLLLSNFWGVFGLGWDKINAVEVLENQVFIAKDDGLMSIPKRLLFQTAPPPPALIRSIRINNLVQPLPIPENLEVDYGAGSFTIEFEGLSYREPRYLRYYYRLTGLDTIWHETLNEAIEFASLRPGKYTFEVKTVNGAGITSQQVARLQIRVRPPFWLRPWFFLLLAGVAAGLLYGYIHWRENRLRKGYEVERQLIETGKEKAELQQKNADLKMQALRFQMNPHFIFNALNTIKGYYGQDKLVEANAFISKFARLLRLNLDYSDTQIPLDQEIELLRIYLQLSQIRYPDKITFQIILSPDINPIEYLVPPMLLQPFVENAVIHGLAPKKSPGKITITFELAAGEILAVIRDTGVGRKAASQVSFRDPHKPLATQITLERLRLLRHPDQTTAALLFRDLETDHQPAGTEVVLRIPFQTIHNQHDTSHYH